MGKEEFVVRRWSTKASVALLFLVFAFSLGVVIIMIVNFPELDE